MIRIRTFSPECIFKTSGGQVGVMLDTDPDRQYAAYNPYSKGWDYSTGHRVLVQLWEPSGESVIPELPSKTKETHDIELLVCQKLLGIFLSPR